MGSVYISSSHGLCVSYALDGVSDISLFLPYLLSLFTYKVGKGLCVYLLGTSSIGLRAFW